MKKIVLLFLAACSLLAGCGSPGYYAERSTYRDRDGDGVSNRRDASPDNPYQR